LLKKLIYALFKAWSYDYYYFSSKALFCKKIDFTSDLVEEDRAFCFVNEIEA